MEDFYSFCKSIDFAPIDLNRYDVPEYVLDFIPEKIARAYKVIPLSLRGPLLTVAMSDPSNIFLIDNLRLVTKLDISPVVADKDQIIRALDKYYYLKVSAKDKEPSGEADSVAELSHFKIKKFNVEEAVKVSEEEAVVNMVNEILSTAVKSRASDIHLEPFEKDVRVRYRIDGILHEVKLIDKKYQEALNVRLKLMSGLDITQRRMPQDGRFTFSAHGNDVDVRTSILPVDFGEKVVLRLLNKASINLDIEFLGFSPYAANCFDKAISKPFGMILLTGPTGSGKTTTLYAFLNRLNTIDKNIITIEDPVEYNLAGITQVPIKHEIGLDFATVLRSTLRQSPDIIMVGEIRDFETVDIAMKASLTGHTVFSTLHTNDAPSAISRLLNMGVEPFLISSSLNMIAAQRLARKICLKCKVSYTMDLSTTDAIPKEHRRPGVVLYRGKGCQECNNTGYRGRTAVVEALIMDDQLKDMIMKRASTETIRSYARTKCGMKTLREDAMDKALRAETTIDEVLSLAVEF